jgi:hypothetical protein
MLIISSLHAFCLGAESGAPLKTMCSDPPKVKGTTNEIPFFHSAMEHHQGDALSTWM